MEQSVASFDNLPDEILYKIFSHVPIIKFHLLSKVCRRFARIYADERFWTKVSLRNEEMDWNDFGPLIRGPHPPIDELDMTGVKVLGVQETTSNSSNQQVKLNKLILSGVRRGGGGGGVDDPPDESKPVGWAILDACNFDELTMHGVDLGDDMYTAIGKSAKLRVLSLDGSAMLGSTMFTRPFPDMFKSCSKLKKLSFSFCVVHPAALRAICFNASTTVETLFLNHMSGETPDRPDVGRRTDIGFLRDFYLMRTLNGLNLFTVTTHLLTLFRRLINLRHLGMSLDYLVKRPIFDLVVKLRLLESLHFCLCDFRWKKFDLLSNVLQKMPNLKRIHFKMKLCLVEDELVREDAERDLAQWFKKLPDKETIITFTEAECVIKFVRKR